MTVGPSREVCRFLTRIYKQSEKVFGGLQPVRAFWEAPDYGGQ
jgi:hypothetical protein